MPILAGCRFVPTTQETPARLSYHRRSVLSAIPSTATMSRSAACRFTTARRWAAAARSAAASRGLFSRDGAKGRTGRRSLSRHRQRSLRHPMFAGFRIDFSRRIGCSRRLDGTTRRRGEVRDHRCLCACHTVKSSSKAYCCRECAEPRAVRRISRLLSSGDRTAGIQAESDHSSPQPDLCHCSLPGPPTTDNHVMREIVLEAMLYERLRQICPTIRRCLRQPKAASICMWWFR